MYYTECSCSSYQLTIGNNDKLWTEYNIQLFDGTEEQPKADRN